MTSGLEVSLLQQSPGRGRALSYRWLYPHSHSKTVTINDLKANVDLDLQPNERITLELMAKKTVYCERNTVIIISLFQDNHKNHNDHDDPGADSEEGGQGG